MGVTAINPDACESARKLATELAEAMTNWGATTPQLDEANRALSHASGLIAVTPIFQGSYSGLFTMFFETLEPHALDHLPTLVWHGHLMANPAYEVEGVVGHAIRCVLAD